ncbi:NAD(P)H-hydrate epimerase [Ruminococcaceae bacterium YRB3002]|nr:NAD(P)H-hydrate epimerase [Ruminococcaceae bacterium YRB3002]
MIDLISVDNMRQSDAMTIDSGVPSLTLMARAARGILDSTDKWRSKKPINIVTGSGNNGGDGFALAILLKELDLPVKVLTLSDKVSPDAEFYREKAKDGGVEITAFDREKLANSGIIVDAMLGTGFKGTPRENYAAAIRAINDERTNGAYVVSADINSGMNGDTGEYEICVVSDLTVTIGYLKKGLIAPQAQQVIGCLAVADIGIALCRTEDTIDESEYGIKLISSRI